MEGEGGQGSGGEERVFFIIFKHSWALKRSWKISHGGPGKSWKSPGFFLSVKEWEPWFLQATEILLFLQNYE